MYHSTVRNSELYHASSLIQMKQTEDTQEDVETFLIETTALCLLAAE